METLELVLDETLLTDEPGCESAHRRSTCSCTVTHRARRDCTNVQVNICDNSALLTVIEMWSGVRCARCTRPAVECWTVNPI